MALAGLVHAWPVPGRSPRTSSDLVGGRAGGIITTTTGIENSEREGWRDRPARVSASSRVKKLPWHDSRGNLHEPQHGTARDLMNLGLKRHLPKCVLTYFVHPRILLRLIVQACLSVLHAPWILVRQAHDVPLSAISPRASSSYVSLLGGGVGYTISQNRGHLKPGS